VSDAPPHIAERARPLAAGLAAALLALAVPAAAQAPRPQPNPPANPPAQSGPAASSTPAVQADAVEQEETFFNVRAAGRIYRLEGLIVKPRGASGKLPVAIFLHGKDFASSDMEKVRPQGMMRQARDLAALGWMVVAFVRRGFGRSDGPFPALANCGTAKLSDQFDADAADTEGVLDVVRQRPDADAARVIAIGVSAGGGAALAFAARNPPGLKAVVNISGGLNLSNCEEKGNSALVEAAKGYAARSKIPQLWIYADNDRLFPIALVNQMHEAALSAGGNVRRLSIEKLEPEGHNVWGSNVGRRTWLTEMDKSLRSWGLPTHDPAEVQGWMKLFPGANRNALERYQSDPGHKALVHSPSQKGYWWRYGVSSESDAINFARKDCEAKAKDCKVVLIGNALQR
jgi:dienelactone hydrolase